MPTSPNTMLALDRKDRWNDEEDEKNFFIPHPVLYFDDGNLILSAGRQLFRVHRSILARHSPALCDLFDHTRDSLYGCPHVPLDHTSEQLEALIEVVYDGCRLHDVQPITTDTFPRLANILRMTTRYGIDHIAAVVVSHIRAEWPSDLLKHATKCTGALALQPNTPSVPGPSHAPSPAPTSVHPASVIAPLRECGYSDPSLLFPLFYALSTMALRSGADALSGHAALLSAEDTARLVGGIEWLRGAHVELMAGPPCPKHTPAHPCGQRLSTLWAWIRAGWLTRAHLIDPVRAWVHITLWARAPGALAQYSLCAECAAGVLVNMESIPVFLWGQLPAKFRLVDGARG